LNGAHISVHAIVSGEADLWTDAPEQALGLVPGAIVLVRESMRTRIRVVNSAIALLDVR
jgi:hypothetical protein